MAYNITNLPAYTDQSSRTFITRAVIGAQTIDYLINASAFDPTAKGNKVVQLQNTNVVIQANDGCSRNPIGDTVLSQATLSVKDLKVDYNYCVRLLEKTYAVEELKIKLKGQVYTDALFLDSISLEVSDKIQAALEQMVWQGNTSLTGSTESDITLKQMDGFLKQIGAGSPITFTGATGSTITKQLRDFDAKMPIQVANKPDYRIFIGSDLYKKYTGEQSDKNFFKPEDALFLQGAGGVQLAPVDGLIGTGKAVAVRMSQLQAGGELDNVSLEKVYSVETKNVYFDSAFSLGVVPVYIDQIGLATIVG